MKDKITKKTITKTVHVEAEIVVTIYRKYEITKEIEIYEKVLENDYDGDFDNYFDDYYIEDFEEAAEKKFKEDYEKGEISKEGEEEDYGMIDCNAE